MYTGCVYDYFGGVSSIFEGHKFKLRAGFLANINLERVWDRIFFENVWHIEDRLCIGFELVISV